MSEKVVSLFIQCLVDTMFPEAAEAMVAVLQRLNIPFVYSPDQTCCGQPAYNSGYRKEAKAAARRFIEIFEKAEVVVCPSGSCVHMVRQHYPELFCEDEEMRQRAINLGNKTFEFSQYLVDELHITDVSARYPGTVTYHDSCHLSRGLGINSQPRTLLKKVEDLTFVEMSNSDTCCGFGGSFSVHYPEISSSMADEKIDNILKSGADTVVGCDVSCLMNIMGRLSRRNEAVKVLHISQILAAQISGEDK